LQTITVPSVGATSAFSAVQDYTDDSLNRIKIASETLAPTTGSPESWTGVSIRSIRQSNIGGSCAETNSRNIAKERTLMKILIGSLAVLLAFTSLWYVFQPVRFISYRIPVSTGSSWIAIEYNRPDCSPLIETAFGREIIVPESGYLCTSSAMEPGWTFDSFYAYENGKEMALKKDEQVVSQSVLQVGYDGCGVLAEVFLVVPNGDKPNNTRSSFIDAYHPECRGVHSVPK
jgi:hypothetical protein